MANRAEAEAWIAAYERAWRTAGTDRLGALFTDDATYRMSPYEEPARGLPAIAALWERERESHEEGFSMTAELVAVEGDAVVARIEVVYDRGTEYRDLWVFRLDPDGRCREFEEWPFAPGQTPGPAEPL